MMEKEFIDCMKNCMIAEKKNDMSFVIKGNGIKRKSDELRNDLGKIKEEVLAMKEKKRKFVNILKIKGYLSTRRIHS